MDCGWGRRGIAQGSLHDAHTTTKCAIDNIVGIVSVSLDVSG